jgi:DNA-binding SARP family transcriptional activator/TolB-like protein
MIQLRVLGDVGLRNDEDGAIVGSVLNQPRRLALLAFLAVESGSGGVQRDRLLGVFWPDLSQDHARQSLRTALHFLRRSLGSTAMEGHGGSVVLSTETIRSDVAEFRTALASGDAETALQWYGGDLLPGFYLDGGPVEFERWLEEARAGLRRTAAEAAWTLAGTEAGRGNAPAAGAWARRAAQLFHGDEAAVRRSMELLGQVGDKVGALEVYQGLSRRLREDFDTAPSTETEAVLARVRDDGGAHDLGGPAPAGPAGSAGQAGPPTAEPTRAATVPPARRRPWVALGGAAMISIVGIATALLLAGDRGAHPTDQGRESVIHVDDFRDFSPDDATMDFAGSLTMELMGRLSDSEALRVVSLARAANAPVSTLRPTYVLRGGIIRSDSLVRVTAILLDGASGATLDRISAEARLDSPTAITEELAESLARRVRRQVGRAVEDYERGASSKNERALTRLRDAIRDIEASDSLRHAGAAEVARAALVAADSQLVVAQTMAPGWSEPWVQRAEISYRMMWLHLLPPLRDPATLERSLRSGLDHANAALSIAPDDPVALELRGLLRYWLGATRSAGSEAANAEAMRLAELDLSQATQLDAGRGRAWSTLSGLYEARGDYAAANLAARRAFRADPYLENAVETTVRLFSTSLEVGDSAAARRWCADLGRRLEGSWLASYCLIEQMAWEGPPPGVGADSIQRMVTSAIVANPTAHHAHSRIVMIGAVALTHLGLPDAQAALRSATRAGGDSPEFLTLEAWGLLILGEEAAAIALLERAAASNPRVVRSTLQSRRFEALRTEPRLRAALADA